ncbi:nitric-oxide synthase [Nocardioides ginsengisegetis]|uniref:Nitric-oxide synthase n=1 Tax=Nocardioides ginsengisegetis TaxID=661491 RepID=A0A7W3IY52_9ACTN|nr:nitric oxide synthase oxygenase [Nocardioides ginsengisegetis]MBA8802821.1 nitric-oxide synthase [Nocardioides ginsengisegetis]
MHEHQIERARHVTTRLSGFAGPAVLGLSPWTPVGLRDPGWMPRIETLTDVATWLTVTALGLCLVAGVQHLVAFQAAGPRLRGQQRRRSIRRRPEPVAGSGCPVPHGSSEPRPRARRRVASTEVDRGEAEEFLRLFHAENPEAGPVEARLEAVLREIDATGTYWHTAEELAFGARVAWRNNARCIGRLYWRSLQVRDLRTVGDAEGVATHCFGHLRAAGNGGKIRPMISVFAPEAPGRPAPRIWNEQLIRYAGYELPDGRVLGDPRYVELTRELVRRGWRPPLARGAFDVLPLVVETAAEGPRMFPLPAEAVHEVELEHPELPWFRDLRLRWHAVPVISNSRLVIGGVSYPTAPFNGWYMGTEIGARNLGDKDRYDLVPEVARRMGLDTSREATLWRDRALVELNRAVLHSYQAAGVAITDHHTESVRFLTHVEREERAGRSCPADWSWIVPPMSGSQTPVFHRYYDTAEQRPAFVTDPDAAQRGLLGAPRAFG